MRSFVTALKLSLALFLLCQSASAVPSTRRSSASITNPNNPTNIPTKLLGRSYRILSNPADSNTTSRPRELDEHSKNKPSLRYNDKREGVSPSTKCNKRFKYRTSQSRQSSASKLRENKSGQRITRYIQERKAHEAEPVKENNLLSHSNPGPATLPADGSHMTSPPAPAPAPAPPSSSMPLPVDSSPTSSSESGTTPVSGVKPDVPTKKHGSEPETGKKEGKEKSDKGKEGKDEKEKGEKKKEGDKVPME